MISSETLERTGLGKGLLLQRETRKNCPRLRQYPDSVKTDESIIYPKYNSPQE